MKVKRCLALATIVPVTLAFMVYYRLSDKHLVPYVIRGHDSVAETKFTPGPPDLPSQADDVAHSAEQYGLQRQNWSSDQWQQKAISEFCARHPELKLLKTNKAHLSNMYRHLLHVEQYKLLYCYVPKAGCTHVKELVESLAGILGNKTSSKMNESEMYIWSEKVHGSWERQLSLLSKEPAERELILQSYYTFVILRDPVERLLSAYKNKLEVPLSPITQVGHNSSIRQVLLKDLKNRLKRPKPFEAIELEQEGVHFQAVPFEDFLHFLRHTALQDLDQHFMPIYHMCNPCVLPYNLYSNFGTITKDVHRVLKEVGAPLSLFKKKEEHPLVEMKDFMDIYFGQMPSAERETLKQQMTNRTGFTFEAAPSEDVSRQLLKEVFQKYSIEFDLYYSLFPYAAKTHKKYFPELDF